MGTKDIPIHQLFHINYDPKSSDTKTSYLFFSVFEFFIMRAYGNEYVLKSFKNAHVNLGRVIYSKVHTKPHTHTHTHTLSCTACIFMKCRLFLFVYILLGSREQMEPSGKEFSVSVYFYIIVNINLFRCIIYFSCIPVGVVVVLFVLSSCINICYYGAPMRLSYLCTVLTVLICCRPTRSVRLSLCLICNHSLII